MPWYLICAPASPVGLQPGITACSWRGSGKMTTTALTILHPLHASHGYSVITTPGFCLGLNTGFWSICNPSVIRSSCCKYSVIWFLWLEWVVFVCEMSGGDKSCITDVLARSHSTKWTLGGSAWGRWGEKTLCGWFLHAGRPPWCRCSPPIMCTISMNLLPRKGQAPTQKGSNRKVPETHTSLPVCKSHCNTFYFSHRGKEGQTQTVSPTDQKHWNVFL